MMCAMLRTVLGPVSNSVAVVGFAVVVGLTMGCRKVDGMDLEGPPEWEGESQLSPTQPNAAQPNQAQPNPTQPKQPAKTQPTSSTPRGTSGTGTRPTPSRPPRPKGGTSESTASNEGGRLAGITAAHNEVRAGLKLPALVWAPEVAQFAQAWANKLQARGCELQHRPGGGADAQKYGENIFWSSGSEPTADEVVGDWVAERKNFDANTNKCKGVCGHYTQVVWRKSQKLGCGMAACGQEQVWVCNYDPPGNFVGERPF